MTKELNVLPRDAVRAALLGRVWLPGVGPAVIAVRQGKAIDISDKFPLSALLLNEAEPAKALAAAAAKGRDLGPIAAIIDNSEEARRDEAEPFLLAPVDLQAIKACGVTFAASLLERVIEERTKGDPRAADAIRNKLMAELGLDLTAIKPGSEAARKAKEMLTARGLWSQYLEVGIGPDAEVFTKSQPMSALGHGATVGIHPASQWSNPEPEVVLVVDAGGRLVGATLGNDVNLRDFEGRSALLLGRGKDNNGSCSIGPFIRLIDKSFGLEDIRKADLALEIAGADGFRLEAVSSMSRISRDPWISSPRPWATPINIPTGWCSSRARCSRRPRTATAPARASPTSPATASPSPATSSAPWPTPSTMPTASRPGTSASSP